MEVQQALAYLRTACIIGKWGTVILAATAQIMMLIHIAYPIITNRPRSSFWIECALKIAKFAIPLGILTSVAIMLMEKISNGL